jgi:hypothetical protein
MKKNHLVWTVMAALFDGSSGRGNNWRHAGAALWGTWQPFQLSRSFSRMRDLVLTAIARIPGRLEVFERLHATRQHATA